MNTELNEIQLRQATARDSTADSGEEAEAAALHKSFLSFGAAVEASAADFDEAALISRLEQSCLPGAACEKKTVTHVAPRPGWWLVIACGALAATLLFAVARIVLFPPDNTATIASTSKSDSDDAANEARVLGLASGWHDPLDDELALAAATIQQLATPRSFDGSLWQVGERLDALSEELSRESL
jgi:hypothetical protein